MQILIIEDELPAYKRLHQLLQKHLPGATILGQLDTVTGAIAWLEKHPTPDIIFMDIQLADGLSFDILETVSIDAPLIFTTAFDQYTLQAFKHYSVDYLLKPIDEKALQKALQKFRQHYQTDQQQVIQEVVQRLQQPQYRERFLIKSGSALSYLPVDEIAYLFSDQSMVFARKHDGKQYHLDYTLDQLEDQLSPLDFFRISRKAIIAISSLRKIESYFNGRLLLSLHPTPEFKSTVSRDRASDFKKWLDR